MIEDDNDTTLPAVTPFLSPPSEVNTGDLSSHIQSLTKALHYFASSSPAPSLLQPPTALLPHPLVMTVDNDVADAPPSQLQSPMPTDEILCMLHHPGTSFPSIRPSDTSYASDKKTHWTAEELHRAMGCRKFRNYKHLVQVSRDGEWVNGGKSPASLGSYATIPKSTRGKAINR